MTQKLAFIGFGVVGQGLAEILVNDKKELLEKFNYDFEVVAISDKMKGSIYNPDGLDLKKCLELVEKNQSLEEYSNATEKGWDSLKTISDTNANVIIEVSWTDIQTGEPALTHVKNALNLKKHVAMTNKGPIALQADELLKLADKNKVFLKFEGTVLSGTPVINLGLNTLGGSKITEIHGILNGTTNYILTEMEKGLSYADALKQAQELGYAEADPTGDVEGWDALGKVVILANVLMNYPLKKDQVKRQGITNISMEDVIQAKNESKRWKLIASIVVNKDGTIDASVKPVKVDLDNPLANIMGPTNALTFKTKYVGDVTVIGPGAGKLATGFSLLTDLLEINRLGGLK